MDNHLKLGPSSKHEKYDKCLEFKGGSGEITKK